MACCNACKISGMGKKKHKVGGMSGNLTTAVVTTVGVPVGIVAAHELKSYIVPMLYADTDTDDQKATKNLYANIGGVALGAAVVAGGVMLKSEPEIGGFVKGLGGGIVGQCLYAIYVNNVKKEGDGKIAGKWDAKAWSDAKRKAMAGADNAAAGLAGPKQPIPFNTSRDFVGAAMPFFVGKVGTCSM